MNYFELFDIPISFTPDKNKVQQQFYALSKKYHPDFYALHSDNEKAVALEQSSYINTAYKTLMNDDAVIQYILQLKGLLKENEKYTLTSNFLMEMVELNEQLADISKESAMDYVLIIKDMQQALFAPIQHIIEHYKEGVTTEKELLQIKDYYYKKKYLTRILEGVQK